MADRANLARLTIDWRAPWLAPLAGLRDLVDREDWKAAVNREAQRREVRNAAGRPIAFVAPDDAGATAYEAHIAATGRVPTRDNAHDLFNTLAWLAYPRTKAALNSRQATEIARLGVCGARGAVRDAATLIDESGLLLAADTESLDRLESRDWPRLLIDGRERWHERIVPIVFGHALFEKLLVPYKGLTAAVVSLPLAGDRSPEAIDEAAADWVLRTALAPKQLAHLPVLGIPGWWPANEDPDFYADEAVFRPPRRRGE